MPCKSDLCTQGRTSCPTPYTCQYEDSGYLPREQAALEADDRPPVSAEDTVTTAEKIIFALGAIGLLVIVYSVTRLVWPILSATLTLWRNTQ
jgi:hypothetical protein